ncbi:MAG: MarR family transcriptional regulator, partial [Acidimicrobiales bacterium]
VLAALSRRPLGLRSVRAVARSASVSPATATSSLDRLQALGLVRRTIKRVVEGEVVDAPVWEVDWTSAKWLETRSVIRRVIVPRLTASPSTPKRVPRRLHHLFWNADPWALDVGRDADYLAARILASEDSEANAWMAAHLPADAISRAGRMRGIDTRRRDLSVNLARRS